MLHIVRDGKNNKNKKYSVDHLTNTWTLLLAKPPTPSLGTPISSHDWKPTCTFTNERVKGDEQKMRMNKSKDQIQL